MEEEISLKLPFKSQTDLVKFVQALAKKSVTGLQLLGIPESSTIVEVWRELTEVRIDDVLDEKQRRLDELADALGDQVAEVRSAAIDVESESRRLDGLTDGLLRIVETLKVTRKV